MGSKKAEQKKEPERDLPKDYKEEPYDDVLERMQKLSQELDADDERKQRKKRGKGKKQQPLRLYQLMAIGGVVLTLLLGVFFATCRNKASKERV